MATASVASALRWTAPFSPAKSPTLTFSTENGPAKDTVLLSSSSKKPEILDAEGEVVGKPTSGKTSLTSAGNEKSPTLIAKPSASPRVSTSKSPRISIKDGLKENVSFKDTRVVSHPKGSASTKESCSAPNPNDIVEEEDVPIDETLLKKFSNVDGVTAKAQPAIPRPDHVLNVLPDRISHIESNFNQVEKSCNRLSQYSQSSSVNANGYSREITETWSSIVKKMKFSILSVFLNGCLLFLLNSARDGVVLSIQATIVNQFGGIILLVVLMICNAATIWSLNEAGSCLFGYLLSSKNGFSFAVCGYMHVPPLAKMPFAQSLSLTSKYRKILSRTSFIWIIVEFLKFLIPISAVSLVAEKYAFYNDVSNCVYFVQDSKLKPFDRKWPNLDTEGGVAEYVFGSSLGIMRSEVPGVNMTTAMYPPQLISALSNGDVIQGLGFAADISTVCKCAVDASIKAMVSAGVHESHALNVLQEYMSLKRQPGLTFGIVSSNDSLVISNVFSGYSLCGGNIITKTMPLVCSTTINNHRTMMLEIMFMTDGTSASIAPHTVTPLYSVGKADIPTWLFFAMNSILNGPVSSYLTPPTVPGSLSPLLWWTTPNLIGIDRAILESGMETMYAILFKAGIQRTYSAKGTQCPRKNLITSYQSTVSIISSGYMTLVILLVIQMVISICSILAFSVWLFSPTPVGPAVRATQEPIYLITLLQSSNNVGIGLNDLCNAESYSIWQRLDVRCRIGEHISTMEDEIGKIVVDKPSLVRPLQNGKKYF
ncbi:hypothetical protein BDR26DRAFT_836734 [Obelidium mucronatum]|nr:hypothetical protein BDR26DRAFT_836734 [Obelidium mucronatum]